MTAPRNCQFLWAAVDSSFMGSTAHNCTMAAVPLRSIQCSYYSTSVIRCSSSVAHTTIGTQEIPVREKSHPKPKKKSAAVLIPKTPLELKLASCLSLHTKMTTQSINSIDEAAKSIQQTLNPNQVYKVRQLCARVRNLLRERHTLLLDDISSGLKPDSDVFDWASLHILQMSGAKSASSVFPYTMPVKPLSEPTKELFRDPLSLQVHLGKLLLEAKPSQSSISGLPSSLSSTAATIPNDPLSFLDARPEDHRRHEEGSSASLETIPSDASLSAKYTDSEIEQSAAMAFQLFQSIPDFKMPTIFELMSSYIREQLSEKAFTDQLLDVLVGHIKDFLDLLGYLGIELNVYSRSKFVSQVATRDRQHANLMEDIKEIIHTVDLTSSIEFRTKVSPLGKSYSNACLNLHFNCQSLRFKIRDGYAYQPLKVFLKEIPMSVSIRSLQHALRHCGTVQTMWVFDNDGNIYTEKQWEASKNLPKPSSKVTKSAPNGKSDKVVSKDTDATANMQRATLMEEVLASASKDFEFDDASLEDDLSTEETEIKAIKKKPKLMLKEGNIYHHAFVLMADTNGYLNLLRDDVRCFGICIQRHNCRTRDSATMKSLILEPAVGQSAQHLKQQLSLLLPEIGIHCPVEQESSIPSFLHLEFQDHAEAWWAFEQLSKEADQWKVWWIRPPHYKALADKTRDQFAEAQIDDENDLTEDDEVITQ